MFQISYNKLWAIFQIVIIFFTKVQNLNKIFVWNYIHQVKINVCEFGNIILNEFNDSVVHTYLVGACRLFNARFAAHISYCFTASWALFNLSLLYNQSHIHILLFRNSDDFILTYFYLNNAFSITGLKKNFSRYNLLFENNRFPTTIFFN